MKKAKSLQLETNGDELHDTVSTSDAKETESRRLGNEYLAIIVLEILQFQIIYKRDLKGTARSNTSLSLLLWVQLFHLMTWSLGYPLPQCCKRHCYLKNLRHT